MTTRNANGYRVITVKAATGISIAAVVAVVGCIVTVATFMGWTPAAIRENEREMAMRDARISALEMAHRHMPSSGQVEDLSHQLDELSGQLAELRRLLQRYGISEDNLVPRRTDP